MAGPSVAGVHNAAAGTAAWGLPRASPQLDHTRINAGKADQQLFVHSFANKFFLHGSFLLSLNFKSSTEYISIAVVTYETMILSTICSRYYNQLQSVR